MLGKIFGILTVLSLIYALASGRADVLASAAFSGAGNAVTLSLSLAGIMCLWSGLMNVVEKTGAVERMSKRLGFLLKRVFPESYRKTGGVGIPDIAVNLSANLLGLGNAATPIGLRAMERLSALNDKGERASGDMIMFVLLNCASIQLIPTTLIALRTAAGSSQPMSILIPTWICAVTCFTLTIFLCRLLAGLTDKSSAGRDKGGGMGK
ncbi:MAG: nucleoside recognition domain-containing protein [Eubacteriales bacterium]